MLPISPRNILEFAYQEVHKQLITKARRWEFNRELLWIASIRKQGKAVCDRVWQFTSPYDRGFMPDSRTQIGRVLNNAFHSGPQWIVAKAKGMITEERTRFIDR